MMSVNELTFPKVYCEVAVRRDPRGKLSDVVLITNFDLNKHSSSSLKKNIMKKSAISKLLEYKKSPKLKTKQKLTVFTKPMEILTLSYHLRGQNPS